MGTYISQREDDCGDEKTKAAVDARLIDECNGITFTNLSSRCLQIIVLSGITHSEYEINERRVSVCAGGAAAAALTLFARGRTVCGGAQTICALTRSLTSRAAHPTPSVPLMENREPNAHVQTRCILRTTHCILDSKCAYSSLYSPRRDGQDVLSPILAK